MNEIELREADHVRIGIELAQKERAEKAVDPPRNLSSTCKDKYIESYPLNETGSWWVTREKDGRRFLCRGTDKHLVEIRGRMVPHYFAAGDIMYIIPEGLTDIGLREMLPSRDVYDKNGNLLRYGNKFPELVPYRGYEYRKRSVPRVWKAPETELLSVVFNGKFVLDALTERPKWSFSGFVKEVRKEGGDVDAQGIIHSRSVLIRALGEELYNELYNQQ